MSRFFEMTPHLGFGVLLQAAMLNDITKSRKFQMCSTLKIYSRAPKRRIISSLPAFDAMRAAWLTMK
jgi:hypothetical protein